MVVAALLTLQLLAPAEQGPPRVSNLEPTAVWLALGSGQSPPSSAELRVTLGSDAHLYVVVEARDTKTKARHIFASVPKVKKGGRLVAAEPWPKDLRAPDIAVYRVEANPIPRGVYDNTGTMEHYWHPEERASHPEKWHWCPIDVVHTDTGWGSVWSHAVDATATTTPDYGGLGTMRFTARVRWAGKELWAPGKEHHDAGGLLPGIATLRVRRDDTTVGYMTELINVPYVYGSSSPNGAASGHQAERAVGADCADLIVYGWRRAGRTMDYTWTQGLKSHTRRMAVVPGELNGVYRTAEGKTLEFGRDVAAGDILLWPRHVAVVAGKDRSGRLTTSTPVLHTVAGSPELEPLGEMGFGFPSGGFEVRRPTWVRDRAPQTTKPAARARPTRPARRRGR